MKPRTKSVLISSVAVAGLVTLAIINPKPADPTPPAQMLAATGSAYDPTVKIAWSFSTIRNHPMVDKSGNPTRSADIPYADVKAGDTARLVMVCGKPERECASGVVKLPKGPLEGFRAVVVMHEVSLVYPIGAWMERERWNGAGAIPAWERRINAQGVALLGRVREQVGVRPWKASDAEIIVEDDVGEDETGKRRAVRP